MENKERGCPYHPIDNIEAFDALDPKARETPWPYYDWLRADPTRAVYPLPQESAFYLIHRYEDVKAAFADSENFSNKIIPTVKSPFFALMDGESHRRIRSVVAQVFSPKQIQQWETPIRHIVEQATATLVNKKSCELFETWAIPIPLGVLAFIFGLPDDAATIERLHAHTIAINRAIFVTGGTGPRRRSTPNVREKAAISWALIKNIPNFYRLYRRLGIAGLRELGAMFRFERNDLETPRPNFEHIPAGVTPFLEMMLLFLEQLKPSAPQPEGKQTPALALFRQHIENGDVSLAEMMMAGAFILFAGHETTTSLLSNCVAHLAHHPDMIQELRKHPDKIEDFVEETLRFYTPVGRFLRRANKDIFLDGTCIPKDAIVLLMVGAANTDPEKFDDACRFDLHRKNARQHLSFGKGIHFCIGAPLARLQATLAIKTLLEKATHIQIDPAYPLKMVTDRDNGLLRYETLPVHVNVDQT